MLRMLNARDQQIFERVVKLDIFIYRALFIHKSIFIAMFIRQIRNAESQGRRYM